jgi:hypothetical protein
MTIDDAIHDLETYGHHFGSRFIAINFDKSHELVLKKAVEVLEKAGMIERDKDPKWSHCNVRIINRPKPRIDYTKGL